MKATPQPQEVATPEHAPHGTDARGEESGISGFALRYPYLIVVGCLVVTMLGTLALSSLPNDLLPSSNQPAVQILSFYPGMPVENIENDLTARFERYTGQAVGMARQESRSLAGVSVVRNFFRPDIDLNTAVSLNTSLVMSVLRRLPPGTQPPLILPFDPMAAVPLALVAVSGDFPEKTLSDKARYDVSNAIQAVAGAMAPTVMGGAERQIVVYLDPAKLSRFNFSPLDVLNRMTSFNSFVPTGDIKIGKIDWQILSNGLADKVDEMNNFPLRAENGVTVRLRDVGVAKDASKIQTNIVNIDDKRQVYVPVYRQPGANSIRVVDEVREAMKRLESRLPGFALRVVADQSSFIRHAIESIAHEALIGGGLAALMVLLFLGNPRATFGIVLSIPLSLLCAFLGLKACGETVNAMTLGGLALSIGVLVDNSIVVLENIMIKRQNGMDARSAAAAGAREVAMPVLASTLSTLVVLFPVVFLGGISKVLFSALAKSVTFAMIGSYVTAMTVIPLFASRFLGGKMPSVQELPAPLRVAQRAMAWLMARYHAALSKALRHPKPVLAGAGAMLLVGALLAPKIGTELFPRADAGNLVLKVRLASGTRIEESERFAKQVTAKLREWIPKSDLSMIITNIGLIYGLPAAYTPNSGPQDMFFNIELTPERHETSQHYAALIRKNFSVLYPKAEIGIELGGLLTSALNGGMPAPIDVQIEGPDARQSADIGKKLVERFRHLPGATDVRVQQRFDMPTIKLDVDRNKAGLLGITVDEIVKNVVSSVSGSSSFSPAIWVDPKTGIDYLFGVQVPEKSFDSLDDFKAIPVTGRYQDRSIPLNRIATVGEGLGASESNHVNLRPVIDVYLDAEGRDIGSLSRDVQREIAAANLPKGYTAEVRGEIQEMTSAVTSLQAGFLLAAVLVYFILVVQFTSFRLPAIIMAAVPLGMVGIVLMLVGTGTYFSIQAAIGSIFMIGIAVANGVLLIEFMMHRLEGHRSIDAAILEAATARLRPILMTSLASMLGLIPMAVGLGRGSEANIPLGRAVIGGQFVATVLTLFVVPVLFRLLVKKPEAATEPGDGQSIEALAGRTL